MSDFRDSLIKRVSSLQSKQAIAGDLYRKELESLKRDFEAKKEALVDEWEKIRIASILRTGGAIGAAACSKSIGLSLFPAEMSWLDWMVRILSAGLIVTASLGPELKSLLPAQRKVRTHPLLFINRTLNKIKP